jgi:hypothetical protein
MQIPNEIVTTKIWKQTLYNLKILAAKRGKTMTGVLDELVTEALQKEEEKRMGHLKTMIDRTNKK